ncbi:YadA C-terminal domain-containing protein [Enterobacter huaxiensis]|nr:YadA C-terminal domain-containing protein [Enterobacter huaxiensis]
MKKTILVLTIYSVLCNFSAAHASILSEAVASQLIAAEKVGTSVVINEAVSNFNGLSDGNQAIVIDGLNANGHGTITHQLVPHDSAIQNNAKSITALQYAIYVPVKPANLTQSTPVLAPSKTPEAVPVAVPAKMTQSTPVVQLVPMAAQQTPQTTPARPQSVSDAINVPVLKQNTRKVVPAQIHRPVFTQKTPEITGTTYRSVVIDQQAHGAQEQGVIGRYSVASESLQKLADDENAKTSANSVHIADNSARLSSLESAANTKFAELIKEVNDNRKRASAGIAGVAAMANIPQVIQGQNFSIGAGAGTTDGESALAVGFSARATEHVVVKASATDDS